MIKNILFAAIAAVVLLSCNSNEVIEQNVQVVQKAGGPAPAETGNEVLTVPEVNYENMPSNPENIYDYVGKFHNEILGNVLTAMAKYWDKPYTFDDICDLTEYFAQENEEFVYSLKKGILPGAQWDGSFSIDRKMVNELMMDYENYFKNAISNLSLSDLAREEVSKLVYFMAENANTEHKFDYKDFYTQICNYEWSVSNTKLLEENEKMALLSFTSTARYSVMFWEQLPKDFPDFPEIPFAPAGLRWWKWLVVAAADAIGAVGGAAAGTAVAINPVAGAVLGGGICSGTAYEEFNRFAIYGEKPELLPGVLEIGYVEPVLNIMQYDDGIKFEF